MDPTEADLVRSMARIAIGQSMLVLAQGKGVPVLKKALPIFEQILKKKNLSSEDPGKSICQGGSRPRMQWGKSDTASSYVARLFLPAQYWSMTC